LGQKGISQRFGFYSCFSLDTYLGSSCLLQVCKYGKSYWCSLGEVLDDAVYELPDKASVVKIKILFDIRSPFKEVICIGNDVDDIN